MLFVVVAMVLYAGIGFAIGRKQGREKSDGLAGHLAVHPHHALWKALGGLVVDGTTFTIVTVSETIRSKSGTSRAGGGGAADTKSSLLEGNNAGLGDGGGTSSARSLPVDGDEEDVVE